MTHGELCRTLAQKWGISIPGAERALSEVFFSIMCGLAHDERVSIPEFGTFSLKHRKARTWMHPMTGRQMDLPARRVVKFTSAKDLKDWVNPPD